MKTNNTKKILSSLLITALMLILLPIFPILTVEAVNPYLPLWEHLPDGSPRVFEDPDNPGLYRAYIIGSHDVNFTEYCGPDIRVWSAPVDDLTNWRDDGPAFTFQDPLTGRWDTMYAPDMVEVLRRDETGARTRRYFYLFPHSRGPGREGMVARGYRPDGPFEPINLNADGRTLRPGSIIGFDPGVFIEYVDDPSDPDYEIGFRAWAYWGFVRSYAAQLDQNTMWSLRPGTELVRFMIPSSTSFGVLAPGQPSHFPHVFPGEDLLAFNFFEAACLRQVGNKFVLVYSGYSGPDYGLGSTNATKRFAFADTPLGPWRSGGVLIDPRGPMPNEQGTAMRRTYTGHGHNTHGSILEINGQWYVFYHRAPRNFGYARQPMVAPIHLEWDEAPVSEGGEVRIRGFCPFAYDNILTVSAGPHTYTGAQLTSEGFQIFGLPPYRYYSAGIASYLSHEMTQADAWNIWDDHAPIVGVGNGHRIGYMHFGFGGLNEYKFGLRPFEGTAPGNNTHFNLFLTPRTNNAFRVHVWLDSPWNNNFWDGTRIGTIEVPANSAREVTQFAIDVAQYVDHLEGKHALFLVVEGGAGALFDLIGLGFSSNNHPIERPIVPTVYISVDGDPIDMPPYPVRSTPVNGIVGFDIYETIITRPADSTDIPVVTATASHPDVQISIVQITEPFGTVLVKFDWQGVVKTYRVIFEPLSGLGDPMRFRIVDSNPVFEGPARIAWGDVIGFLDPGDPPGAVTFTINVPEAGMYRMYVYHNTPWGAASHAYQINGGDTIIFDYPQFAAWRYSQFPYPVEFNQGANTIRIAFNSGITEVRAVVIQRYLDYVPPLPPRPDGRRAIALNATVTIPEGTDWEICPVWSAAEVMVTDVRVSGTDATPAMANVRALWDDDYLYVLLQVTDSALRKDAENAWEQDSVEVFLSETNHNLGTYHEGDGQFRVNFANYQSFGSTTETFGFRSAVRIVEGRGYDVIMAIPFYVITPEYGMVVGFDAQVNDRNEADTHRANVMKWNDPTDDSWRYTTLWGFLTLGGEPRDECVEWEWVQVWAAGAVNYTRNYHKLYLMQREYGNTRPYNIDRLWLRSNPSNSFGLLSATSGDDQITGIGLFTDGLTYKFGHGPGDYRNIYRQPNRDMPDITVTEVTWDIRWHYQVADLYLTNVERTDGTVVEKYYIGQIFNKAHYVRNGFGGHPAAGFHFGIRLESNRIHIDIWLPEHIYRAEGLQVVDLTDALHNWSTARNGCPIENVGPNPRRTYTRYCAGIAIDAISTWYRRPVPCDC